MKGLSRKGEKRKKRSTADFNTGLLFLAAWKVGLSLSFWFWFLIIPGRTQFTKIIDGRCSSVELPPVAMAAVESRVKLGLREVCSPVLKPGR